LNNYLTLKFLVQPHKGFPNIPKDAKFQKVEKSLKSLSARTSPWKFSVVTTFLVAEEQLVLFVQPLVLHIAHHVSIDKKRLLQWNS
jgi:hypothetical protein